MAEGTPWLEDGSRSPAGTSGVERGAGGGPSAPGPGPVVGANPEVYTKSGPPLSFQYCYSGIWRVS